MSEIQEKVCVGCGENEEQTRLELCSVCRRSFCADCAHRGFGRRFCSHECARAYYFAGDLDDDENSEQYE